MTCATKGFSSRKIIPMLGYTDKVDGFFHLINKINHYTNEFHTLMDEIDCRLQASLLEMEKHIKIKNGITP